MPTKTLPETAFQLLGGCFCSAVRYTISVPSLSERPLIPSRPETELVPLNKVSERLPMITLDHCTSCRRIAGAIMQSWPICLQSWVSFTLLPRSSDPAKSHDSNHLKPTTAECLKPSQELQEKTYLTGFKSSEDANRTFCGRCGTHLTFFYSGEPGDLSTRSHWGPYFDIANGSIDREGLEMDGFKPSRTGWEEDGIEWVKRLVKEGKKSLSE